MKTNIILIFAISLTLAQITLFGIYQISNTSMEPTFSVGTRVLVNKMAKPKIDDIVVFKKDRQLHVKRVLGLSEDIFILNGHRFVVPKNHIFVIGDNKKISMDSRDFGAVSSKDIIGKVIFYQSP